MERKIRMAVHSMMLAALFLIFATGCKKKDDNNTVIPITATDIDGNVYSTVTIGNQVWMTQNLRTTKYNDGTPIPNVTDATDWFELITGGCCDYDNDPANSITYGKLYNWHAVNSGKLCPAGWHVASDNEWSQLENYLGGASAAGGKLKETGTTHWQSPNTGATNTAGFIALPAGYRSTAGLFSSLTTNGFWWTGTVGSDPSFAWYHGLDFDLTAANRDEDNKIVGLSVRCIKD